MGSVGSGLGGFGDRRAGTTAELPQLEDVETESVPRVDRRGQWSGPLKDRL